MKLALAHARAGTLELARQPQFWVPSMFFPALFFVLFGISVARDVTGQLPPGLGSEVVLAPFLCFGLLTIMFFQFGVGIAEERKQPWEVTLRVLPVSGASRFAGRVGTALVFCVAAVLPVLVIALTTSELALSPVQWLAYLGTLFLGAVPFGLMGITLGYATTPKAALPIANIAFLLLSFLGGLFVPVDDLPGFVRGLTPYLPSKHYLDAMHASAGAAPDGGSWTEPALYLAGWTLLFLVTTIIVYRRDQGVRYR